jgi:hypothetical protein
VNESRRPRRKSLHRSVIWRRLDIIALEYFELRERADAIGLSGTILMVDDAVPLRAEYQIRCDRSWVTQSVRVALTRGAESRELNLVTDGQHRWWKEGEELAQVAGCIDIDISITPSTNTLPIRRLGLRPGEERDVSAAWVKVPDLTLEPLPQRYLRTEEGRYRYQSRGGDFTADIDVDEMGLVTRYPPLWERVAAS